MGDEKSRQFSFGTVLELTTKPAQELIKKTAKQIGSDWQAACEEAYVLSQDKDRMEIWQKLVKDGAELSPERALRLALAERIRDKTVRQSKDGWVESAKQPEDNKEDKLRGEAVKQAGDGVMKGVVETVERS